jgi:hypothetical protein
MRVSAEMLKTFVAPNASTKALDALFALFLGNQVDLVQHQPARLLVQRFVVAAQLLDDGARVVQRIGRPRSKGAMSTKMQQQAGALQVAQELVAETGTFGRAFDQARECRRCTKLRESSTRTTPRLGASVVKG